MSLNAAFRQTTAVAILSGRSDIALNCIMLGAGRKRETGAVCMIDRMTQFRESIIIAEAFAIRWSAAYGFARLPPSDQSNVAGDPSLALRILASGS